MPYVRRIFKIQVPNLGAVVVIPEIPKIHFPAFFNYSVDGTDSFKRSLL